MNRHIVVAAFVFLFTLTMSAQQPNKSTRPSPPGTTEVTFADGKKVTIEYSRPFAKGRKIYGGLVPYDEVWRTGANEATSLKTDGDVIIGGTAVPAGSYTLFTIPSSGAWKLIINKQTGQWGTNYDPGQDLGRANMSVSSLPQAVEQFTISLIKTGGDSAKLNLDWEKTRASVDVKEKK